MLVQGLILALAAFCGGALNAVAGGGSFFSFPALLFVGVDSVRANATSNLALWPGFVGSIYAYRRDFPTDRKLMRAMSIVSLFGGVGGAVLLVVTPSTMFDRLVPWLLLFATVVFTFGRQITQAMTRFQRSHHARPPLAVILVGQLVLAIYGGYFGGGVGLMMLAAYTLLSFDSIHQANALKTLLAGLVNAVALLTFVIADKIVWPAAAVMVVGALLGGYVGAAVAQKLPSEVVRRFVMLVGWSLTAYFFAVELGVIPPLTAGSGS